MHEEPCNKGVSILEVVVSAAIILVLTTAIAQVWRTYLVVSRIGSERTQAALLLEEAADELQFIRDKNWATISGALVGTTYYLTWATTTPVLSTTPSTILNKYTRKIVFSYVGRDAQQNISSGGTLDAKTRKATITIHTNDPAQEVFIQGEQLIHEI